MAVYGTRFVLRTAFDHYPDVPFCGQITPPDRHHAGRSRLPCRRVRQAGGAVTGGATSRINLTMRSNSARLAA